MVKVKRLTIIVYVGILLNLSANIAIGKRQDWEFLDCIDSKHAAMIHIENAAELVDSIKQSNFFQHPLMQEVRNHLESDDSSFVFNALGVERLPSPAASTDESWESVIQGPVTILVSIDKLQSPVVTISFKTGVEKLDQAISFFSKQLVGQRQFDDLMR